jgi:hypothetical protein
VLKKARRSVKDDVSWYRYERHCRGSRNDSRAAGKVATTVRETPGKVLGTLGAVPGVLDGSAHAASASRPATASRSTAPNLAMSLGRVVSAPGSSATTTRAGTDEAE